LMKAIAQTLHGPFIFFPVPAFSLRVALGEMSVEVLKSNTVSSEKVQEAGFKFHYPTIKAAFNQLVNYEGCCHGPACCPIGKYW
jgi:NAD dependent epimerase/dehydratase family enzyme